MCICVGFWDDSPPVQKSPVKPTVVVQAKPNNTVVQKNVGKSKAKKEEAQVLKHFEKNGPVNDEFTAWCTKTLAGFNVTDLDGKSLYILIIVVFVFVTFSCFSSDVYKFST